MEDLPPECLQNILSFLPIADVFVCRSVCRKWKGAADSVIRGQQALTFIIVDNNKRTGKRNGIVLRQSEHPLRHDDQTPLSLRGCWRTRPNGRNIGVWIKRLQGMVRLEKLVVVFEFRSRYKLADPLKSLIDAVIMRNASTLTTIDCNLLLFDPKQKATHDHDHPVLVFGKLQNLICERLTPAAAAACPRLVRLKISRAVQAEVMQSLPQETIQYLDADPHTWEPQDVEAFVTAVSRMTQLRELNLGSMGCNPSLINPDPLFIKIFNNMKRLEKINFWFPIETDGTVDGAIERLVRNNPRLTHVKFIDANVTAASLVSLSRLTGVEHLSLWHFHTKIPEFTTDDVLMLLRGGSRQVLQYVRVEMRSRPDQERIEAEARVMEQEMGSAFSVIVDSENALSSVIIKRRRDGDETVEDVHDHF